MNLWTSPCCPSLSNNGRSRTPLRRTSGVVQGPRGALSRLSAGGCPDVCRWPSAVGTTACACQGAGTTACSCEGKRASRLRVRRRPMPPGTVLAGGRRAKRIRCRLQQGAEQGLFWAWRGRAGVLLGMAGPATHSFDAHNLRDKTVSACRPRIIGPGVGHARGVDRCQHGHRACGPMPTDPGHKGKAVAMSVQVYVVISRERSGSLCHRACEGVALLLGRWSGPKIFGSRKAGNH